MEGRTCYNKGRNPSQLFPFLLPVTHFLLRVDKDILENYLVVWPFRCSGHNPLHCSFSDREVYRCIYNFTSEEVSSLVALHTL